MQYDKQASWKAIKLSHGKLPKKFLDVHTEVVRVFSGIN